MAKGKNKLGRGFNILFGEETPADMAEELPIQSISPNQSQPRRAFDEGSLKELADSIRVHGVVQPILVRKKGIEYELIAGERRLRASELAGKTSIPAIVRDYDDRKAAEIALIENLQREDLNPLEESMAYEKLIQEYDFTQEQMAETIGKSRSYVANMVRLLSFPEEIKTLLAERKITAGQVRPLLALKTAAEQIHLARRIAAEGISARKAEEIAKSKKESKKGNKTLPSEEETYFHSLEEELKLSLGTAVHIQAGKGKKKYRGMVSISFYDEKEFDRIMRFLKQSDEE